MNKSRRKFLGKAPALAVAAGVGVASSKVAMASPTPTEGTRQLLEEVIANQRKTNGKLYAGDDLILQVLRMLVPNVSGIDLAAASAKLDEAEGYIEAVPGDAPPGCELPPDYDDGYGGGGSD